jgi:hypothetical protein
VVRSHDWTEIIFSPVVWVRFPHMLLAAYVTGAFCVAATGAWYMLRNKYHAEAHIMLRMGLGLAAVLVPVQLFFGHLSANTWSTTPAGEDGGDRGAVARRAACRRGPARDGRTLEERRRTFSRSRFLRRSEV